MLPHWLLFTKGHGFSLEYLYECCPSDIEPYEAAYQLEQKQIDVHNWTLGCYVESAVLTAVEKNLAGKKAKSKYIEKPLLSEHMEKQKAKQVETGEKKLSKAEIQRQRELLYVQLGVMKLNFDLEHGKGNGE